MHSPVFQVLNEVSKHHDDEFYGYAGIYLAELITNAVQSRDHALLELIQTTLTSDCEQFCTTERSIHWHRNPDEFTKNITDYLSLELMKTALNDPAATPLIIPFVTNVPSMILSAVNILGSEENDEVQASVRSFVQSIYENATMPLSPELLVGLAAGGPSVDDVFSIEHTGDQRVDIALALGCARDYGLATSLFKRPNVSQLLSGLRCTRKTLLADSQLAKVVSNTSNELALIIDSMLNPVKPDAVAQESMFSDDLRMKLESLSEWLPDYSGNKSQAYQNAYIEFGRLSTRLINLNSTLLFKFPVHERDDERPETTLTNWISITKGLQAAGNEFDTWCAHIATSLGTFNSQQLLELFELITSLNTQGDRVTPSLFKLANETHQFTGLMKLFCETLSHPNCPDTIADQLTSAFSTYFSATHALTLLSSDQTLSPEHWSLIGKSLTQSKSLDDKGALIDHLYAMALLIPQLESLCPQPEVATWLQATRQSARLHDKSRLLGIAVKILNQFDRVYLDEKNTLLIQTYQQLTPPISAEQSAIHDLFSSQPLRL